MIKRVARALSVAVLALAVAWALAIGGTRPSVAYGADPTPTPAQTNSGDPGGSSGGGH